MHDNEKEIVQVVGRFYMYVFDSAMRYFQEECSNCAMNNRKGELS